MIIMTIVSFLQHHSVVAVLAPLVRYLPVADQPRRGSRSPSLRTDLAIETQPRHSETGLAASAVSDGKLPGVSDGDR